MSMVEARYASRIAGAYSKKYHWIFVLAILSSRRAEKAIPAYLDHERIERTESKASRGNATNSARIGKMTMLLAKMEGQWLVSHQPPRCWQMKLGRRKMVSDGSVCTRHAKPGGQEGCGHSDQIKGVGGAILLRTIAENVEQLRNSPCLSTDDREGIGRAIDGFDVPPSIQLPADDKHGASAIGEGGPVGHDRCTYWSHPY